MESLGQLAGRGSGPGPVILSWRLSIKCEPACQCRRHEIQTTDSIDGKTLWREDTATCSSMPAWRILAARSLAGSRSAWACKSWTWVAEHWQLTHMTSHHCVPMRERNGYSGPSAAGWVYQGKAQHFVWPWSLSSLLIPLPVEAWEEVKCEDTGTQKE